MTDTDILTDATREASLELAERLEYELKGAWRADYDYVHLYTKIVDPDPGGDTDEITLRQAVLPSDREEPPNPPGYRYAHTYLTGELDSATVHEYL